jgi:hypothetical protein
MKLKQLSALAALVAVVGACEQESQPLPFSVTPEAEVTRSIPASGGTLSTAAGASVQFPAGALGGGAVVTLRSGAPAAAVQRSGSVVSAGYGLEPEGTVLAQAAPVELRIQAQRRDSLWLASVVNVAGGVAEERGSGRVDLATGVVRASIGRLGNMAVVVPEAAAIVPVGRTANFVAEPLRAPLAASGTDSLAAGCGAPGNRCHGMAVGVSANLLDQVENAALVYPQVRGALRLDGGRVSGALELSTALRAQLRSGATSESVEVWARVAPTEWTQVTETASAIQLSYMRIRVAGEGGVSAAQEEVVALTISKCGQTAPVTVTRSFRIDTGNGMEDARVSVTFPVRIHQ